MEINKLLDTEVRVVNIGLEDFFRDLKKRGVAAVHVEWSPPAGGDPKLGELLVKLGG